MARLHIDLPTHFPFATELAVYGLHVNWAGHLDNALLLTLVSEARVRFLRALGYSEGNVEGLGIVVADAAVQYLSEAFAGETLAVDMAFVDPNRYGGDWVWRMRCVADGRDVARGKTGFVFVDRDQHRVAPMPAAFLARASAIGTA